MAAALPAATAPAGEEVAFRSKQMMVQQAGRLGLVQLVFDKAPGKPSLYAHSPYLIASSGVLRGILDDQDDQDPPAKVARLNSSADAADALTTTIPLDDEETATWECVLAMLYPHTVLRTKVAWDNIKGLLLLAAKYDVSMVLDRAKAFLDAPMESPDTNKLTRLGQALTEDNVLSWLQVFSRCGIDSYMELCIGYILRQNLQIPEGYLGSGIQPQHTEQLFKALAESFKDKIACQTLELQCKSTQINGLQQQLKELRSKDKLRQYHDATCVRCCEQWYWLLNNSKEPPICMYCGVMKRTGFMGDSFQDPPTLSCFTA